MNLSQLEWQISIIKFYNNFASSQLIIIDVAVFPTPLFAGKNKEGTAILMN